VFSPTKLWHLTRFYNGVLTQIRNLKAPLSLKFGGEETSKI